MAIGARATIVRWQAPVLLLLWAAVSLWLVGDHVFWRDEVRAWTIARHGATLIDMLRGLHGEGHPAIWYFLLRYGDMAIGKVALPVMAYLAGLAAAALLIWKSPFDWWVKALILASKFMLFEYVVMARNYGISVVLMFGFAALYPTLRTRTVWLGVVLALLANTNIHSAILGAMLWLFWALDTAHEHRWRWTPQTRRLLAGAAIFAVGVLLCFLMVYPTYNDASTLRVDHRPIQAISTLMNPGRALWLLVPYGNTPAWENHAGPFTFATTLLVLLPLLRLPARPAAAVAGLGGILALTLLFTSVYRGYYRHQALLVVFEITLFWLVLARDRALPVRPVTRAAARVGAAFAVALLGCQLWLGIDEIRQDAVLPQSRSRDLAALIAADPTLRRATIIANPDYLIEAMPYYVDNPVYRLREAKDGPTVHFTRHATLDLNVDDVVAVAERLHAARHQPVLILIRPAFDPAAAAEVIDENSTGVFRRDPASIRRFLARTTTLAKFGPVVGDESYAVYRLD